MGDLKKRILQHLQQFASGTLRENALALFETLGYRSAIQMRLEPNTVEQFLELYDAHGLFDQKRRARALCAEWKSIDFLFQLTEAEITEQHTFFQVNAFDPNEYQSYLFFAIELQGDAYPRGALAAITREINRLFLMPAMILFKHGDALTFAIINRRLHKLDSSKDVLEKVTLIKDIRIAAPHRAHLDILFELSCEEVSRRHPVTNFLELHRAWQNVLDIQELNKRFFRELANWYFWAVQEVEFPDDAEPDRDIRSATSVIRLLTRLMFVWFLKEKQVIPDALFDKAVLDEYLKYDDATGSTYYKAILQNLFFATLNTEMAKDNPHSRKFVHRQYGVQGFYRYSRLFHDPDRALELFRDIPFLNGGLFENLDKQVGTPQEVRIDCFSDRRDNEARLKVPDRLFFGEEAEIDLSQIYGDARRRHEKVKGLIPLLKSYKFTIAENTPVEEEIALDPELLGKVFENLLASYNPETRTTARKQTGSFYTPREIVNYMVDESVIAYLKQALLQDAPGDFYVRSSRFSEESALKGELQTARSSRFSEEERPEGRTTSGEEERPEGRTTSGEEERPEGRTTSEDVLRDALSYSERPLPFDERERRLLIAAINRCKILDPACGSGAFPMGILHKMVHVLSKLDPENARWKAQQIETQTRSIKEDIAYAEQIRDDRARQKALDELHDKLAAIHEAFDENELDYSRKLYLIENGIYGVDIQPVAVQIAKLRFFISLIVDQKVNPGKANLGILPLPNLETKFVAANTLIGVEKPAQMTLRNPQIDKKETELKQVRQRHFDARTPVTKDKYRREDERLRRELADLLQKDGFPADVTEQLAHWNPYDQNASAGFFDPEWMFGLKDGFDIVIGNPPYVQLQSNSGQLAKIYTDQHFETFIRTGDLYCLFYEKANQLLKQEGVTCYITSNKWMRAAYGEKLRKYFAQKTQPLTLIDVGPGIFEAATVDTNIFLFAKNKATESFSGCKLAQKIESPLAEFVQQCSVKISVKPHGEKWDISTPLQQMLTQKIEQRGTPLKEWYIQIYRGVLTGYNKAFIIDGAKKDELIAADPNSADIIKPLLRGRDIQPYKTRFADSWLIATFPSLHIDIDNYPSVRDYLKTFGKRLEQTGESGSRKKTSHQWFETQDNIAFYQEFKKEKIVWKRIGSIMRFSYDDSGAYCLDSTCIATGEHIKFLVGVLNSKMCLHELVRISPKTGTGDQLISVQALEPLCVPKPDAAQEQAITALVDRILAAKQQNSAADTRALEAEIDRLVYKLYNLTYDEVQIIAPNVALSAEEYQHIINETEYRK